MAKDGFRDIRMTIVLEVDVQVPLTLNDEEARLVGRSRVIASKNDFVLVGRNGPWRVALVRSAE